MEDSGWLEQVVAQAAAEAGSALLVSDLGEVEQLVQRLLRQVGRVIVEGVVAVQATRVERALPRCATCSGPLRRVGQRTRVLVGLVGEYHLQRGYQYGAACRAGQAPLDLALGLGTGVLAPGLARVVAYEGSRAPFAEAAQAVAAHHGVGIDAETVRALTEGLGQLVEVAQQDRQQWLVAAAAVPAVLVVEVDGVLVHERAVGRECKVGRLAPLGPTLVQDPRSAAAHLALGPSTYCAGLEGADAFWARVGREAWRVGLGRGVRTVVVLGDGAPWIWRQARCQLQLPGVEVVEIVDFYHACEYLSRVAEAVFGAQSAPAAAGLDQQRHLLYHHGARPVRRALAALRARAGPATAVVGTAHGYFRSHTARMRYPTFRARLFPIGSGAIESCAQHLIRQRQVQAGMRWSVAGAQAVASLRAVAHSGRWDAFWREQPLRRLRLLPAPAPAAPVAPPQATPCPPAGQALPLLATAPAPAAAPSPQRIQTAGKSWAKGKDFWRRSPIAHARSLRSHCP